MFIDDLFYDCKAEAAAASTAVSGGVEAIEPFKYTFPFVCRYERPRSADRHMIKIVLYPALHFYGGSAVMMVHRVIDQVRDHLLHTIGIHFEFVIFHVSHQCYVGSFTLKLEHLHTLLCQLCNIHEFQFRIMMRCRLSPLF